MRIYRFFLTIFLVTLIGCASIPKEAPELSLELGKQISSMEKANITLLNRFFDQKRSDIDKFIENEWVPVFTEEIFLNPAFEETLRRVFEENNDDEKSELLLGVATRMQQKINERRTQLINEVDDLEIRIERQLRAEYSQMKSLNNSITSFLVSASEVDENRNRYLEMIGVSDDRISQVIDQTDSTVNNLLGGASAVQSLAERQERFIDQIKSISLN